MSASNMNLSFAGCGFLGIYHVGVAVCFRKYAPHILLDKISGASFGAISACCLLCDLPLGEITSDVLRVVGEARAGSLGPFSPSFNVQNVLLQGLLKFLPADAHRRVSGKLHISLTRVYDGKNVIVSEFASKADLLQALMASCFIPVFSGMLPPRFHGIRYMDGGFSDNLPILDENTVTVSPFCGESDICPRDLSSQLFHVNVANTSIELSKQNINRFARILFPPKPEVLSNMCKQGFDDALRFLHRNKLISCTRCLAVQSTFQLQASLDETLHYAPDCAECETHRQDALVADLPDTVMTVFQNAIDSANQGLVNWVFRHRGMKILSFLTLPYTVPVDIVYATFTKLMSCKPRLTLSMRRLALALLQQLHGFLYAAHDRSRVAAHIYSRLARDAKRLDHRADRRLMSCKPRLTLSMRRLALALLQQLHGFLYAAHDRSRVAAHIYSRLARDAKRLDHRADRRRASVVRVSLASGAGGGGAGGAAAAAAADDAFEHILSVTTHHDALLAYYYLDDGNKMKMTEIYDVTDAETEVVQSPVERDANRQLEFDNEWAADMALCHDSVEEVTSLQEELSSLLERPEPLFSEPESEWCGHLSRSSSPAPSDDSDTDQPESDQKYATSSDAYTLTHH